MVLLVFCVIQKRASGFQLVHHLTSPSTILRNKGTYTGAHVTSSSSTVSKYYFPTRNPTELAMARGPPRGGRRPPPKKEDTPPMNQEIKAKELRVVVANNAGGKDDPLGIISREEALAKAKELGNLDLVLINDKSDPPVCKIVDYSKYRYTLEKKAKEVKKNSKVSELKEVKMSYKIDVHDYGVRKKSAQKFLEKGNRVKATVMFRGREVTHDKLGYELLDKLSQELEEIALREGRAKKEGRNLSLILSPKPEVMKAITDQRKAQDKKKKLEKVAELQKRATEKTPAVLANGDIGLLDDDDDDDETEDASLDDLFTDDFTDNLFDTN